MSVADWNAEISRVYRAARRGRIDAQRACRLVFVASAGLKAAGQIEELARIADVQRKLEQMQAQPVPAQFANDMAEVAP